MQLEFSFMYSLASPWDGQYTFKHYIAKQAIDACEKENPNLFDLGPFKETEMRAWTFVLDNVPNLV